MRKSTLLMALLAWCAACDHRGAEPVGSASVALSSVPDDVACVQVTAAGATRTAKTLRSVVPGREETFVWNGLPVGLVTFTGAAFGSPCAAVQAGSVPNWLSDPVSTTISVSEITAVSLLLRRNGRTSVSIDFEDAGDAAAPDGGPDGDVGDSHELPDADGPPMDAPVSEGGATDAASDAADAAAGESCYAIDPTGHSVLYTCGPGQFCFFPYPHQACGSGPGAEPPSCIERPTTCPQTSGMFCSCEGAIYCNECFARMYGSRGAAPMAGYCSSFLKPAICSPPTSNGGAPGGL